MELLKCTYMMVRCSSLLPIDFLERDLQTDCDQGAVKQATDVVLDVCKNNGVTLKCAPSPVHPAERV